MNILVIEDNQFKRDKITDFIKENYDVIVVDASSYNGGVNKALEDNFDLIVLDLSMPTFDRTDTTHGGRFRSLAGKDVATKLERLGRLVPFVVLTGYKDFSVNSKSLNIGQIDEILSSMGDCYRGCIIFDAVNSAWEEQLSLIIEGLDK